MLMFIRMTSVLIYTILIAVCMFHVGMDFGRCDGICSVSGMEGDGWVHDSDDMEQCNCRLEIETDERQGNAT